MAEQTSRDSTPAESIEKMRQRAVRAEAASERTDANSTRSDVAPATAPHPVRNYRALVFQGYVAAAVVIFAMLGLLAHSTAYFPIDLAITRTIQTFDAPWFDNLMQAVTWIGRPEPQAFIMYGAIVVLLFVTGLRWESVVSVFALCGYGLALFVKLLVNRPRPELGLVHVFRQVSETSFPSGHVVTYTAFFGFLWFLAYTVLKHSWQRTVLLFILGGLVVLIGPSRIYLGEHWFSDVIAAYLLGSLWLSLAIYLYRWGKSRFFVNQPVAPPRASGTPAG